MLEKYGSCLLNCGKYKLKRMPAEIRQSQRLEQGLAITPQLKRSLEILQAPSLDLRDMIVNALQTNPLLEEVRDDELPPRPATVGENNDDDFDAQYSDFPSDFGENNYSAEEQTKRDFILNSIPDSVSLQEYLLQEANLDAKNAHTASAFENLVGHMDDRGFLPPDALDRARAAGFPEDAIEEALRLLRNSPPSGIGAFDMRDSLLLQLSHKKMGGSLAYRILDDHYDLLMKRRVDEIAELENREIEDVEEAIAEIAKLNTSPAHEYFETPQRFITADVVYRKIDGEWEVELTNEYIPKLRINPEYRSMIAQGKLRKTEESYVKEKIRDGKSLMDAIELRQQTLFKIAQTILIKQIDFFEIGADALKPMTMQDVADVVEVHSTTVGRAVSEKFADTPHGLFALKYFFNGGYAGADGDAIASASVKEKIRAIIESEPPSKPFSDAKIAEILSAEKIDVARRTIAKYREEMGIPVKTLRKRF